MLYSFPFNTKIYHFRLNTKNKFLLPIFYLLINKSLKSFHLVLIFKNVKCYQKQQPIHVNLDQINQFYTSSPWVLTVHLVMAQSYDTTSKIFMTRSWNYVCCSTTVVVLPYDWLQRHCNMSPAYFHPILTHWVPKGSGPALLAYGFYVLLPNPSSIVHLPFEYLQSSRYRGRKGGQTGHMAEKRTSFFQMSVKLFSFHSYMLAFPSPCY